jgi:hypothetical protein
MTTTEYRPGDRPVGPGDPEPDVGPDPVGTSPGAGRPVAVPWVAATAGYLVLSVFVWWHVWSSHPTSTTTCGCGDSSLFTWFLEWPAYAIAHGLDPLYSAALFHPAGVNLLANTAEVGIGVVLAPVSWVFGPVATLNVALTLAPVLSALAMFALLRRWVTWSPAAFVGGLLYGFSPFVLVSLTDAHLMLGMAPFPPLVVLCLDEILVRQHRRPVAVGIGLGLLVTAQFFVGTEILVLTAIAAAIGVAFVVVVGLVRREVSRPQVRYAVTALGTAAGVAVVLLAYPAWFALAGPAHFSGPVWGHEHYISYGGTTLGRYLSPWPPSAGITALGHRFGGYQAPTRSPQYLGAGLVAVLVVGLVLWRRDRRLWCCAVVALATVPLSAGLSVHGWSPWRLFVRLPLMENVIPVRFLDITYLAAAAMLGVIVDHTVSGVGSWWDASPAPRRLGPGVRGRTVGAAAGLAVSVVALVPIAAYFAGGLPFTAQPVSIPAWFRHPVPAATARPVVLVLPAPFALYQGAMTWQAVDRMSFDLVGGGGPGSLLERAGSEAAGQSVISTLTIGPPHPSITPPDVTAVRRALDGWGVTTVVIPDPAPLPLYDRLPDVRSTVLLITAATGRAPTRSHGAWVWTDVRGAGPPLRVASDVTARCGVGPEQGSVASIERSAACLLDASGERA